ncbi:MAG: aspartate aminotransferase family protein [Planctomycetes bacterium]|nr:aspartate aminotransferase family protein [Planctomycetota bacterium]
MHPATAAPATARTTAEIIATEEAWQIPTYAKLPIALVRGQGSYVWDADGRRYLDLYGGHCVAIAGHCHPRLVAAVREQAGRLLFYSNVVYSDVRALAAERVAGLAPAGLRRVFFCNSGTEANETALKLARKHTGRRQVVSMVDGFHGRTLGSLGATGLVKYRDPAYPIPVGHSYVPYGDEAALRGALSRDVAAVILEPIPSMGGIRVADASWFRALRAACDEHGALLVFDEVQTGFGRTGRMFFGEHVGVTPDLITGAKGVAGGVPAGVVFVRESIASRVSHGEQGTTFGGGPLACAAMAAVAQVLVEEDLPGNATRVGGLLRERLAAIRGVEAVTGLGLMLGLNLSRPAKPVIAALRDAGFLTGGCEGDPNQIRLLPPLTLNADEAHTFVSALGAILP